MIWQFEDVLPDFEEYQEQVRQGAFIDVISQGIVYKDCSQHLSEYDAKLYAPIQQQAGRKFHERLNFLRAYIDRPDYRHPSWIHSDALFADYIAIFMACSSELPQDDGVSLWRNRALDSILHEDKDPKAVDAQIIDSQSMDANHWELWKHFPWKDNRLIVFPGSLFHSKATYGNRGRSIDECRIVHVLFFDELGDENVPTV